MEAYRFISFKKLIFASKELWIALMKETLNAKLIADRILQYSLKSKVLNHFHKL
jgi:hypothetical protein